MTIKDCYSSTKWQELEIVVDSAWKPDFVKNGGLMEQMVTISDESGEFIVVNRAIAEEQFVDIDDEDKKMKLRLRCRNGILQCWIQKPAVMGKQKQYRNFNGKEQEHESEHQQNERQ